MSLGIGGLGHREQSGMGSGRMEAGRLFMRGATYSADVLGMFCIVVVVVHQGAQRRWSDRESHAQHRAKNVSVVRVVNSGKPRFLWITLCLWITVGRRPKIATNVSP